MIRSRDYIKKAILMRLKSEEQPYFFNNDKEWYYNACICPKLSKSSNEKAIRDGYFYVANIVAGSLLYEDFISNKYSKSIDEITKEKLFDIHLDTLIFPLFYNYRHFIELSLKHLIKHIKKLTGEKKTKEELNTLSRHDIFSLYILFENLFNNLPQTTEAKKHNDFSKIKTYFPTLSRITKDFTRFDKSSTHTRYLYDNNDNVFYDKQERINIRELANNMQKVKENFFHIEWFLSILDENKFEY